MGTREGTGPIGKYLLIEVPNYNNATSEAEALSSYLRLGAVKDPSLAANPGAPKSSGEDLAALVTSFIDDTRKRDGCPDFIPEAERQAETARLHTKGGWRDHSDGNRVTTTRGDKVEIIKGNYKMIVLGRQNDEAGWDVSGGHVSQNGITFAGSSSIEWTQNYDGTWKVTEETIKGDVFSTYMGDVVDVYTGNIKDSTTGSEAPSADKPNPIITDRTWARSITSYTGSSALPVPSISDETWAGEISSTTNATSISSETNAGNISDTTNAGGMESTTICPMMVNTTIGNTLDTTIGTTTSVILGHEAEIVVGNMSEITLGLQESITVGGLIDVSIAYHLEFNASAGFSYTLGGLTELNPEKRELEMLKQELTQLKDEVGSIHNKTYGAINYLAGRINLG